MKKKNDNEFQLNDLKIYYIPWCNRKRLYSFLKDL